MIAAETALIAALDADDLPAIEAVLPMLGAGATGLRTDGMWQKKPEILDRLRSAIALADAARVRIRYLSDRNQRRIDLLAAAAGRFDCAPATYSRPSRA
jgi:hypothetical protein